MFLPRSHLLHQQFTHCTPSFVFFALTAVFMMVVMLVGAGSVKEWRRRRRRRRLLYCRRQRAAPRRVRLIPNLIYLDQKSNFDIQ